MIRTTQTFKLSFLRKTRQLIYFWESVDANLKEISAAKTIVWRLSIILIKRLNSIFQMFQKSR